MPTAQCPTMNRGEELTAIHRTPEGKQAENAAPYLGKDSHVNVLGRVQNKHEPNPI